MIRNVLTIAGSDPSGGAGIQADLKTFAANGVYGMAALTALTAQNTQGVTGVELVPHDFVKAQIAAVFADVRVDAVKVGMIATADIATAVAQTLEVYRGIPVVLDPVMVAKGGAALLQDEAITALRSALLPQATFLTPNLPEAARLLHEPEARCRDDMARQAHALTQLGPHAVLVKGGHLSGEESPDVLCDGETLHWLEGRRTETRNTHGTGCTLSAALTAQLAKGKSPKDAVHAAKAYVTRAISTSGQLTVGSGHGPVNHFYELWKDHL
ncbi:bifunctional hydroxymethylpyrimidine kinase/phosphomethylpyrimidine kinase [Lentibacter sp. XHP0401]|jgi:hydroxymethylpyrimidine/phosphomethylpyrimidine kinase|uniref:bifunctional hydroxymethylpyrimidine kinase/phosphomethylpyrimidine kinase n=1 Tax=Lentibacter sp. XHP0401 TaxID=2984334 RepID=UPI0021E8A54A|nr:bifunctional hydroxymethylpyrimidine kinase/phosphomethylpyrimidine kinase [Lentibacter sp. XHP0401]MCV2892757.1 bifunctional hydroxymethylpyrimidine kinase/phosphomethylpyrimidine kinase [Lentibacter sp. XHP0401]